MCKATGPCDCPSCRAEQRLSGVDQERSTADDAGAIGRDLGAIVRDAYLDFAGRFAFAVLIHRADSDEPMRETMHPELGDAIKHACALARQGTTAYVYQLVTIAEPSCHLTDLREKGNG
jgi:hypothetical protein